MDELTIEYDIQRELSPKDQEVAMGVVSFWKEIQLSFYKDKLLFMELIK